ncbi:hypothetical protein LT493_00460 [Streptomyces tricolor]|nr:hypothetical protein [Streptomyces tricolor]
MSSHSEPAPASAEPGPWRMAARRRGSGPAGRRVADCFRRPAATAKGPPSGGLRALWRRDTERSSPRSRSPTPSTPPATSCTPRCSTPSPRPCPPPNPRTRPCCCRSPGTGVTVHPGTARAPGCAPSGRAPTRCASPRPTARAGPS